MAAGTITAAIMSVATHAAAGTSHASPAVCAGIAVIGVHKAGVEAMLAFKLVDVGTCARGEYIG
eukprot:2676057-Pleurochrysis_carterae.AAC.1